MPPAALLVPVLAMTLASAPAAAQQPPAPARTVLDAAPGCVAGVKDAYRTGYADGVEAIRSQLAQATARVQEQVQAQLNEQLSQMQRQSTAELDTRIAAAQDKALADQAGGAAPGAAGAVPSDARMPSLSATVQSLDARAARGAVQPSARAGAQASAPADPAALPPGTTITITDPQAMPPELFRALMDYASR